MKSIHDLLQSRNIQEENRSNHRILWMRQPARLLLAAIAMVAVMTQMAIAQPVPLNLPQLDRVVTRIALYPDPLLAQILTASTYPEQIAPAASWGDQHMYLKGDALTRAIQADQLPWDPSVLALLPFPSVLDMMAHDPGWTQQLGDAVLTQRPEVMDAVQRMRHRARDYGYLTPNGYVNVVDSSGYIQILPVDPALVYVPYYDPVVVFSRPRPGFAVASAIRFGPAITIGTTFRTWGWWYGTGFLWPSHAILIDHRPWDRVWVRRYDYVHPYAHPWVHPTGPRAELHHPHR